jgi:hypothetical protein
MGLLAWVMVAWGPVFAPGPVLPEDPAHPGGIEVSQIQRHLSYVEATLRRTAPGDATPEQLRARERALDALHDYWTAGVFPQNRDFPDRHVPYFIDADGTACAVGHLMIASGDEALAREIATYENNDFVAEIDHPRVEPWLTRNGLTVEEAAWIQPAYGPCGFMPMPVCGSDGNSYSCEYYATQCAMVGVEALGLCDGDTELDLVVPECMSESTGADSESEGSGSSSSSDTGDDGGDDDKGCRIGDTSPSSLLLLLAFAIRRRARA